ncbi:MAG: threonylcarbamoyl-AMP synthase [Calditrichaeota bacterium]|nr:threonylcarbamoyl-AMP synthase [Calditrichota bacterium]RQV92716.1 MAG: threonylcarbamoyl-AMP synthase [bacterium]RQW07641.1 MAG: threonylcarbamoyl-AMP synthase [Calditrichota bacterium]
MLRFHIHLKNPHKRIIMNAVEVLQNGGLIIYPTDTVYGIGCDLYNKGALQRIYTLKKKSKFDPVSIIVKDIQQASLYARISNYAFKIMKHCLPGPYTFILPSTREIPKTMLSKRKEVGIRIPDNEVCHTLIENMNHPLVNTSVNMNPDELLNDPEEIERRYQNSVDMMLDADWLHEAHESTVVSLINDEVVILREGKGDVQKLFE